MRRALATGSEAGIARKERLDRSRSVLRSLAGIAEVMVGVLNEG